MSPDDDTAKTLRRAGGYAQLGMYADAMEELDALETEAREQPAALEVLAEIHRGKGDWKSMQSIAKRLSELDPDNTQWPISLAYATRRAESIEAAKPILLEARERHPKEPIIWYNLACYECQTGNMESAGRFLLKAITLSANCKAMALEDDDLRPLREMVREMEG